MTNQCPEGDSELTPTPGLSKLVYLHWPQLDRIASSKSLMHPPVLYADQRKVVEFICQAYKKLLQMHHRLGSLNVNLFSHNPAD